MKTTWLLSAALLFCPAFLCVATASNSPAPPAADTNWAVNLNDDQRAVIAWTDRQFRSYFDGRVFAGWSDDERAQLERRSIDALNGPRSQEYYQAINTLGALRSTNSIPTLSRIAFEQVDRDNRDRWMAVRALGMIGDLSVVPEMIHLVYHGNVNTRWWAQISLVRLTGQNFGRDWNAWAKWWTDAGREPRYNRQIVRWWDGQAQPEELAAALDANDREFLASLRQGEVESARQSLQEKAARLHQAKPAINATRNTWSKTLDAIQSMDTTNALTLLKSLEPEIQKIRDALRGTALESGATEALQLLPSLAAALNSGNTESARSVTENFNTLGRKMEEEIKAIREAARVPSPEPIPELTNVIVLRHDTGVQIGRQSIAGSGHAVEFALPPVSPGGVGRQYLKAVQFHGSRYGAAEPPREDFHVYILDEQKRVIADLPFPYSMVERGFMKWHTLQTPSIELPQKFLIAMNFDPHRTKGVYLALSDVEDSSGHSFAGLPEKGFKSLNNSGEWMIRLCVAVE